MKDLIIKMYSNENFPIYLGTVIVVLLIAFFVVFFLGRKDKKEFEKTQKLEQLKNANPDAFKETTEPVKVEASSPNLENNFASPAQVVNPSPVNNSNQNVYDDPFAMPNYEPNVSNTPNYQNYNSVVQEAPVYQAPNVNNNIYDFQNNASYNAFSNNESSNVPTPAASTTVETPNTYVSENPYNYEVNPAPANFDTPVNNQNIPSQNFSENNMANITSEVNTDPFAMPDLEMAINNSIVNNNLNASATFKEPNLDNYSNIAYEIEGELNELEQMQKKVELPEEKLNNTTVLNVFSSVYAPKKEEEPKPETNNDMEIELPKLKSDK